MIEEIRKLTIENTGEKMHITARISITWYSVLYRTYEMRYDKLKETLTHD